MADLARSISTLLCLFIIFSLMMADRVAAQGSAAINPLKVEAAFMRNFAHYVNWPESSFEGPHSPWRICVMGTDPFGQFLKETLAGRTEQGRSFEIYIADSLNQLPDCHMVFIAYAKPVRRRAVLAALQGKAVLTVGNTPEFLQEGGIIRLTIDERVQMSINLDQARHGSLSIQTKMLEVSSEVVENGIVKRVR